MPETYSAILKGDRLEWVGAAPGSDILDQGVAVEVTIARDSVTTLTVDVDERRRTIIGALERIAAGGTFAEIDDPVEWQREIRQDRPLPGRD